MAGAYRRGALLSYRTTFGRALPAVLVFQFNPERMVHTWTQATVPEPADAAEPEGNPLAVTALPGESFTFGILLHSAEPAGTDVAARLAALEMLQFPADDDPLGGLVGSLETALGGGAAAPEQRTIPENQLPTVLFVWGPGRIVPVRLTALSVTELRYDGALNPIHAEATISLRVLTTREIEYLSGPLARLANGAYRYSHARRQALALAGLGEAVGSTTGMLPI